MFLTVVFAARKLVEIPLWDIIRWEAGHRMIARTPILDPNLDSGPQIARQATISAWINDNEAFQTSFVTSNLESYLEQPDYHRIFVIDTTKENKKQTRELGRVNFDKSKGVFVFEQFPDKQAKPAETETVFTYFGPDGNGETPSKTLGRFFDPISTAMIIGTKVIIYDKRQSCFYRLDLTQPNVTKGPDLTDESKYIQLSYLEKLPEVIALEWSPPCVVAEDSVDQQDDITSKSRVQRLISVKMDHPMKDVMYWGDFIMVLNENGKIEKLDVETLEITGELGHLVTGLGDQRTQMIRPRDLLVYAVRPLVYKGEYKGLVVACLERNINQAAMISFDDKGTKNKINENQAKKYARAEIVSSSTFNISHEGWNHPWMGFCKVLKFLAEILNPSMINFVTCYTAEEFEAISSRQALFFLSDTYIGQIVQGDSDQLTGAIRIIFLSLPACLYSLFFAWRISKNAKYLGLSKNAQSFWIIIVIFFGIPAYITYHLTKPATALVTCPNCGQMRRPDKENCHQCKSPWSVAELIPPSWRVLEG
jgi:hypothetical protein